MKNRGTV